MGLFSLAFFHVPLRQEDSKYLCFIWKGRVYQFMVMCFGVKSAPYTFNKLGKVIKLYFAGFGIRMFIYLDDILVMATSAELCRRSAQFVVDTLISLGFYIHVDKCVLTPSQSFFFLGFLWDTRLMICSLPVER